MFPDYDDEYDSMEIKVINEVARPNLGWGMFEGQKAGCLKYSDHSATNGFAPAKSHAARFQT